MFAFLQEILRFTSSAFVQVTAGKIVPKSLLTKSFYKESMSQEIRSLNWLVLGTSLTWVSWAGFTKQCPTRTWWSSSATLRTPTLFTLSLNFAGSFPYLLNSNPQEYTTKRITRKRSLLELLKRRKAITEPESRYFVHQVSEIIIFFSSGFCAGNTLIS